MKISSEITKVNMYYMRPIHIYSMYIVYVCVYVKELIPSRSFALISHQISSLIC